MGRDYVLRCQDCHDKIDWSKPYEEIEKMELNELFYLEIAFDNCTEIDEESIQLQIEELMKWLKEHDGHTIYFGW